MILLRPVFYQPCNAEYWKKKDKHCKQVYIYLRMKMDYFHEIICSKFGLYDNRSNKIISDSHK